MYCNVYDFDLFCGGGRYYEPGQFRYRRKSPTILSGDVQNSGLHNPMQSCRVAGEMWCTQMAKGNVYGKEKGDSKFTQLLLILNWKP
jgi:hypothetical protein